jgi:hypothetical protein
MKWKAISMEEAWGLLKDEEEYDLEEFMSEQHTQYFSKDGKFPILCVTVYDHEKDEGLTHRSGFDLGVSTKRGIGHWWETVTDIPKELIPHIVESLQAVDSSSDRD